MHLQHACKVWPYTRATTPKHITDAHLEAVDAGLLFGLSQLLPVWLLPAAWLAVRKRLWPAEGMGGTLPVQSASTTSASSLGRMICPPDATKWHSLAALQHDSTEQFAFARVVCCCRGRAGQDALHPLQAYARPLNGQPNLLSLCM